MAISCIMVDHGYITSVPVCSYDFLCIPCQTWLLMEVLHLREKPAGSTRAGLGGSPRQPTATGARRPLPAGFDLEGRPGEARGWVTKFHGADRNGSTSRFTRASPPRKCADQLVTDVNRSHETYSESQETFLETSCDLENLRSLGQVLWLQIWVNLKAQGCPGMWGIWSAMRGTSSSLFFQVLRHASEEP